MAIDYNDIVEAMNFNSYWDGTFLLPTAIGAFVGALGAFVIERHLKNKDNYIQNVVDANHAMMQIFSALKMLDFLKEKYVLPLKIEKRKIESFWKNPESGYEQEGGNSLMFVSLFSFDNFTDIDIKSLNFISYKYAQYMSCIHDVNHAISTVNNVIEVRNKQIKIVCEKKDIQNGMVLEIEINTINEQQEYFSALFDSIKNLETQVNHAILVLDKSNRLVHNASKTIIPKRYYKNKLIKVNFDDKKNEILPDTDTSAIYPLPDDW